MKEKFIIYTQSAFDLCLLLFASLADIEIEIRIIVGLVGIGLSILTAIKIIGEIRRNQVDMRIKAELLKREQEATRRFFEDKYSR